MGNRERKRRAPLQTNSSLWIECLMKKRSIIFGTHGIPNFWQDHLFFLLFFKPATWAKAINGDKNKLRRRKMGRKNGTSSIRWQVTIISCACLPNFFFWFPPLLALPQFFGCGRILKILSITHSRLFLHLLLPLPILIRRRRLSRNLSSFLLLSLFFPPLLP